MDQNTQETTERINIRSNLILISINKGKQKRLIDNIVLSLLDINVIYDIQTLTSNQ